MQLYFKSMNYWSVIPIFYSILVFIEDNCYSSTMFQTGSLKSFVMQFETVSMTLKRDYYEVQR